jgi:hypothetical protein
MRSNAELGAILYPKPTAPVATPPRVAPPAPTQEPGAPRVLDRAAAGKALYDASKSGQVGSIANAVASAFDRIEATLIDDKERLERTRQDRRTANSLLEKANVAPSDAHALLSTYREARSLNRSGEALAKAWAGPHGFDRLRLESGSTEAALEKIAQTDALLKRVEKDNPGFAYELRATGAAQDPRFIQTAAKIIEGITKPKEQTT